MSRRKLTAAQVRLLTRARTAADLYARESLGTGVVYVAGAERVTARWLETRGMLRAEGRGYAITDAGRAAFGGAPLARNTAQRVREAQADPTPHVTAVMVSRPCADTEGAACKGCLIGAPIENATHWCAEGIEAAHGEELRALPPPRHEQELSPAQRLLAASCGVGEMPVAPAPRRGR